MRGICARVYTHLPYPRRHRHVSATSAPSANLYIISKLTPELCSFSPLHFDLSRSQTFYLQFGPKHSGFTPQSKLAPVPDKPSGPVNCTLRSTFQPDHKLTGLRVGLQTGFPARLQIDPLAEFHLGRQSCRTNPRISIMPDLIPAVKCDCINRAVNSDIQIRPCRKFGHPESTSSHSCHKSGHPGSTVP